jgi:hypothetical protein
VVALLTALRLFDTVDSDVAWQLWIAGRVHAGARLYTDIIEVNPPLWFWMALPLDRLAALLHVRVEAVLIVTVSALAALALAATDALLRHIPTPRRTALLAYAALVFVAMPWMHCGQREQLMLIGTVPYAALVAARRDHKVVPPALAAVIGTGAGIGFALKHYFLIVPALLELWLLIGQRRTWRLGRPEIFGTISVGVLYAGAILLWAPDFLTRIVPLVRLTYGDLAPPGLRYLFGPHAILGLLILALVAGHMHRSHEEPAPFTNVLAVAALGFTIVYFIQFKGWIYHAIPLVGCASLALAALLAEAAPPGRWLGIIAPALLSFPFFLAADDEMHPALPNPDLINAVEGVQRGETVGFLTVETAIPWSITLQRGFRYPSRYMGYWMLTAVVPNERRGRPDARLSALGAQIVSDTIADFTCEPPRRIVVARPPAGRPGFDILPFFLRDPRFGALLSHYRVRSRTSFETYELVSPFSAARLDCRKGV